MVDMSYTCAKFSPDGLHMCILPKGHGEPCPWDTSSRWSAFEYGELYTMVCGLESMIGIGSLARPLTAEIMAEMEARERAHQPACIGIGKPRYSDICTCASCINVRQAFFKESPMDMILQSDITVKRAPAPITTIAVGSPVRVHPNATHDGFCLIVEDRRVIISHDAAEELCRRWLEFIKQERGR